MNREEFLDRLRAALNGMSEEDRADAALYFEEMIADRASDENIAEEEVIAQLEPVEKIAEALQAAREAPQAEPQAVDSDGQTDDEAFRGRKTITLKADAVRSLLIDTAHVAIRMDGAEGNEIELSYTQDDYDIYDFSVEGGALRLVRRPIQTLFRLDFGLAMGRREPIVLKVPRELAASCELKSRNASIAVQDISFWSKLSTWTSNGSMGLRQLSLQGELTAHSSNGKITLEALKVRDRIEAETTNGGISATGIRAADIRLTTSNGKIEARELDCQGDIALVTRNSRLEASALNSPTAIRLQTSNGALHVERIAAPRIDLSTSNGPIRGDVRGAAQDYSVQSQTSNGKNNLSAHPYQGPRQLSTRTSNSGIQIDFRP